ncbi:IclR family transcriptional regulator [Croceicoccus ponticola]|uniref:IclR family transcriptional regulator n=1 Tax=Croceicoccus ponticola TaxID=2217664 RepID=A0A437GWA3_9SPHN|nr:IclR family transcriptional regulator [Croceicoccus ponticola]RVQ66369.1 IclR family transcriptional regulator [Croceicoccus ponticola]
MTVRRAENTLEILEYFARRLSPATAAEIAEELGWPRSSTFKLVGTMAAKGYLYEPRPRGGYYPSPRWLDLAERVTRSDPVPNELHAFVRTLVRETGETSLIAAMAGDQAIFLDVQESSQPVRYTTSIGSQVPIYASSAGRALMAQMSRDERQRLYRRLTFETFSPTTPDSAEAVEAELAAGKERGFHQSNAEYTPDLAGVSLPLPYRGQRLSAVVVGPVSRCLDRRSAIAAIIAKQIAMLDHLQE